jgi:type II secretory pathway pseudopilin PulG
VKGLSEVATLSLYAGITVTAVGAILTTAVPALEDQRDASQIRNAQDFLRNLDSSTQEVVSEGQGSTRELDLSFSQGNIEFDARNDTVVYSLQTDAEVVSPQTSIRRGNIVLANNARVSVRNETCEGVQSYVLENEHIKACIRNVGSQSNQKSINTSDLLVKYRFKDQNRDLNGNLSVLVNSNSRTSSGTGFTSVPYDSLPRNRVGSGQVTATVGTTVGNQFTYDVVFQLPTGADFLKIDVQNFR